MIPPHPAAMKKYILQKIHPRSFISTPNRLFEMAMTAKMQAKSDLTELMKQVEATDWGKQGQRAAMEDGFVYTVESLSDYLHFRTLMEIHYADRARETESRQHSHEQPAHPDEVGQRLPADSRQLSLPIYGGGATAT